MKLCLSRLCIHQAQHREDGLGVLGLQVLLQLTFQSLGPFLDNCLVAMGLSKAVVSLATNAFQMEFARYSPLQITDKILSIMERIAQIPHSLHQNAHQTVVSIRTTF